MPAVPFWLQPCLLPPPCHRAVGCGPLGQQHTQNSGTLNDVITPQNTATVRANVSVIHLTVATLAPGGWLAAAQANTTIVGQSHTQRCTHFASPHVLRAAASMRAARPDAAVLGPAVAPTHQTHPVSREPQRLWSHAQPGS